MAKTVLHVTKFKNNTGGLGSHIDRTKTPKNAEKKLKYLNIEIIKPGGTLQEDIAKRIDAAKIKRKIRTDAVKYVGIIVSGSHEKMKEIEKNGNIKQWAKDNYDFMAEKYGEKNIIRAALHLDEKTPHIHFGIVPVTKDNRLSAKDFFNGKIALATLQDEYALKMAKYGLERGVPNEKRKHITTSQYYKYINQNDIKAEEIISNKNSKILVSKLIEIADNQTSLKHNAQHLANERRIFEESERRKRGQKQFEQKRKQSEQSRNQPIKQNRDKKNSR